jgi:peptidoglycan/LPS O-acetylase OafA/YrhL
VVIGSWSLCTEEQFYLLAPLAIILSAPYVRSLSLYRLYLWLGLLALPVIRLLIWYRLTGDLSRHDPALWNRYVYQPIHSNCDGLLMGLFLASLAVEPGNSPVRWGAGARWALFALACAAAASLRAVQREVFNLSGMTLVLGSLVWIGLHAEVALPRILSASVFYVLSRLSFGIYLNHAYLHEPLSRLTMAYVPGANGAPSLHLLLTEGLVMALSTFCAAVTFCLIEHPFLRLRETLLKRPAAKIESPDERQTLAASPLAGGPGRG